MIRVAITIDVEADHTGASWVRTAPLRFASVVRGVPAVLTPLFSAVGARPTYLVSAEVLDDAEAVRTLVNVADAELGTHLHGDHVPPEGDPARAAGTASIDFASCYPEQLERAKIETITRLFRDRIDCEPRAYRAGRYAASARSATILGELGYAVDCSVTPGLIWINERDPGNVIDHSRAPLRPYHPSAHDLGTPGALPLLEVPITVVRRPEFWDAAISLAQLASGRPRRRYPLWLRPSTTPWPWLRWIVDRAIRGSAPGEDTWLNVMFHSMEVVPGASPYSRTPPAARRVARRLELLLDLLRQRGAAFHTLSEVVKVVDGNAAG